MTRAKRKVTATEIIKAYKKTGLQPISGTTLDQDMECGCAIAALYLADDKNYKSIKVQRGIVEFEARVPKCAELIEEDRNEFHIDEEAIMSWGRQEFGDEAVDEMVWAFDEGEPEPSGDNMKPTTYFTETLKAAKNLGVQ